MSNSAIRIGGACGYWGESPMATPQLLAEGSIDYIVYDYLAEITMSIMARAKAKDPNAGYATDFITAVLKPNLTAIADADIKIISNAGGLNPEACGAAIRTLIKQLGLNLKVAIITGDNLTNQTKAIAKQSPKEMFSGATFPDPEKIASINAYLGAFPIAKALESGADIVITGRCVDSAVTLGPCIYEFGWKNDDYDCLASGSLAGHIIECGPQATGGNFTDWRLAGDIADIGYPIATISSDGSFTISKPKNTTGLVSIGTVSEQLLYEIGDPQAYLLPDVTCDFSEVIITQVDENEVSVSTAKGHPPPNQYKTCATYADGFRTGTSFAFYGFDAAERGQAFADAAFIRARKALRNANLAEFTETSIEIIGNNSQFGHSRLLAAPHEVTVKIAAKHLTPFEGTILLKELAGLGLAAAPGLSNFKAPPPKPTPVIRLFSYLTPKEELTAKIELEDDASILKEAAVTTYDSTLIKRPEPPAPIIIKEKAVAPLVQLAWARSGDKGNKANIGVIARKPEYLPFIWNTLSEQSVADRFSHFIDSGADASKIQRYYLPGSYAINFLIDDVLGGGGIASIRNDPQGKGYAQILLTCLIEIPSKIADQLS